MINFIVKIIGGLSVLTLIALLIVLIWNPTIFMVKIIATNIIVILVLKILDWITEQENW